MIKRYLTGFLFVFAVYFCTAQPGNGKRGQMAEALKVAFITRELNLTTDEAQKFWPVYNSYFEEIQQARKSYPSDEIAFEEAVVGVRKKYKPEFKKILGTDERVNIIFTLDKRFKDLLRKELQRRQQLRQQKGNGTTKNTDPR
jgi:hypothetical protein